MRFRLFKQGRQQRLLALSLASLGCFALGAACGGDEFTSSAASGAGGGGAGAGQGGATDSDAGEGGSGEDIAGGMSSGGSAASPSAGSGGKPLAGCDACAAGEYCQDGANKCRKCTDYTRLEFASPQKLLSQGTQISKRFARPGSQGSALFYVAGIGESSKILYAASAVSIGTPLTAQGQFESGPLLAKGFADRNLFFDRKDSAERKLLMASWSPPSTLTNEELMPGEINARGFDDYSVAISPATGNVYWMSTRNGAPQLLWQATKLEGPPAPAPLELTLKAGKTECPRTGEDATPWVTADGTLLLFRNPSLNESCTPNDSGATDLFAVQLKEDGTPDGPAHALSSLNNTGGMSRETDPTLANDSCSIYFASDNGSGDFDLYRAPRN